jgi:predicted nucleotidyltransferase
MGGRKSLKDNLKSFKYRLNKDIPVNRMIFFGSRTKGKSGRDRDVDLIIVSNKFKKLDFIQRGAKMYDYWNLNYPVDFLCYTPEEFAKLRKGVTIVREAEKEGTVI